MGCCTSTDSSAPLNAKSQTSSTGRETSAKKEDKIELAFKVKRANIFTEGVDLGREAFVQKRIPKTEKQMKVISKFYIFQMMSTATTNFFFFFPFSVAAITSNYIFASLNAQDLNSLAMCMEIVDVSAGENIITQGAAGVFPIYSNCQ